MSKKIRWDKHCWFSLCLVCFAEHHQEGGWCDANPKDGHKCSLCGKKPCVAEFYPCLKAFAKDKL